MEKLYQTTYPIPCYMFDCKEYLRPAAFMDIAQELAAWGSQQINATDQRLAQYGLVWILGRQSVVFDKIPKRGDTVIAQTWHRGWDSIYSIREYRLLDVQTLEPIARASSSWILMDLASRTVVRPDHLPKDLQFTPQNSEPVMLRSDGGAYSSERILIPKSLQMEKIHSHTVTYSDMDYNGHANNAKYSVWAYDALPFDLVSKHNTLRIDINFNREAHFGDTILFLHASPGEGKHLIEGKVEDRQIFVTNIEFNPSERQ